MSSLVDLILVLGVLLSFERIWDRWKKKEPDPYDRIPNGHRAAIAAAYAATVIALALAGHLAIGEMVDLSAS